MSHAGSGWSSWKNLLEAMTLAMPSSQRMRHLLFVTFTWTGSCSSSSLDAMSVGTKKYVVTTTQGAPQCLTRPRTPMLLP
eukprot:CAMPEP_0175472344 /NCGR_PEP_ID=MMETSP0095-20121207/73825_1 /TAXON_ID=311494 /ORGANISM="Alexandrium monilatum, Strain CCMP3105" /LENGTH=79 /DNA_ID=CAMNT_0016773821 /DNA_START=22 /DNA_END=257 /DNA_ORIENTATION=+